MAVLHTPLIVALIPGQSPPDVSIPIFMFSPIVIIFVKIKKINPNSENNKKNKLLYSYIDK